jgi:hypothetical protein
MIISGDFKLIRVILINYFLFIILINSLIYPDIKISYYNI